jgi:roadblock/LC7 domain-containing protein
MTAEPPSISTPQSMTPPALDHVVGTCLSKDPDTRWQTATDIVIHLKWIAETGSQALPETAPKRLAWLMWAAIAAVATAGGAYWLGVRSPRQSTLPETTLRRLTNDPGLTSGAAISPDGKLVAYASDRADSSNLDIWVQQVDGGGLVRVTDDAADDYDPTCSSQQTPFVCWSIPSATRTARARNCCSPLGRDCSYYPHGSGARLPLAATFKRRSHDQSQHVGRRFAKSGLGWSSGRSSRRR